MITLTGTLRQLAEITIKDKKLVKLWLEHQTPAQGDRAGDLKIEELFVEPVAGASLPKTGEKVSVIVRAYPRGRDVAFQALGLAGLSGAKA